MTTLLVIAGAWLIAALVAAFVIGAAMRRADQGERRRLAREHALELQRASERAPFGEQDRRSA